MPPEIAAGAICLAAPAGLAAAATSSAALTTSDDTRCSSAAATSAGIGTGKRSWAPSGACKEAASGCLSKFACRLRV